MDQTKRTASVGVMSQPKRRGIPSENGIRAFTPHAHRYNGPTHPKPITTCPYALRSAAFERRVCHARYLDNDFYRSGLCCNWQVELDLLRRQPREIVPSFIDPPLHAKRVHTVWWVGLGTVHTVDGRVWRRTEPIYIGASSSSPADNLSPSLVPPAMARSVLPAAERFRPEPTRGSRSWTCYADKCTCTNEITCSHARAHLIDGRRSHIKIERVRRPIDPVRHHPLT